MLRLEGMHCSQSELGDQTPPSSCCSFDLRSQFLRLLHRYRMTMKSRLTKPTRPGFSSSFCSSKPACANYNHEHGDHLAIQARHCNWTMASRESRCQVSTPRHVWQAEDEQFGPYWTALDLAIEQVMLFEMLRSILATEWLEKLKILE